MEHGTVTNMKNEEREHHEIRQRKCNVARMREPRLKKGVYSIISY